MGNVGKIKPLKCHKKRRYAQQMAKHKKYNRNNGTFGMNYTAVENLINDARNALRAQGRIL